MVRFWMRFAFRNEGSAGVRETFKHAEEDLGVCGQFHSGEVFGVDPSLCVLECSCVAEGDGVEGGPVSSPPSSSFSSSVRSSVLRLVEALAKRLQGPMGGLHGEEEEEEKDELDPSSSSSSEESEDLEGPPSLSLVHGGKGKQQKKKAGGPKGKFGTMSTRQLLTLLIPADFAKDVHEHSKLMESLRELRKPGLAVRLLKSGSSDGWVPREVTEGPYELVVLNGPIHLQAQAALELFTFANKSSKPAFLDSPLPSSLHMHMHAPSPASPPVGTSAQQLQGSAGTPNHIMISPAQSQCNSPARTRGTPDSSSSNAVGGEAHGRTTPNGCCPNNHSSSRETRSPTLEPLHAGGKGLTVPSQQQSVSTAYAEGPGMTLSKGPGGGPSTPTASGGGEGARSCSPVVNGLSSMQSLHSEAATEREMRSETSAAGGSWPPPQQAGGAFGDRERERETMPLQHHPQGGDGSAFVSLDENAGADEGAVSAPRLLPVNEQQQQRAVRTVQVPPAPMHLSNQQHRPSSTELVQEQERAREWEKERNANSSWLATNVGVGEFKTVEISRTFGSQDGTPWTPFSGVPSKLLAWRSSFSPSTPNCENVANEVLGIGQVLRWAPSTRVLFFPTDQATAEHYAIYGIPLNPLPWPPLPDGSRQRQDFGPGTYLFDSLTYAVAKAAALPTRFPALICYAVPTEALQTLEVSNLQPSSARLHASLQQFVVESRRAATETKYRDPRRLNWPRVDGIRRSDVIRGPLVRSAAGGAAGAAGEGGAESKDKQEKEGTGLASVTFSSSGHQYCFRSGRAVELLNAHRVGFVSLLQAADESESLPTRLSPPVTPIEGMSAADSWASLVNRDAAASVSTHAHREREATSPLSGNGGGSPLTVTATSRVDVPPLKNPVQVTREGAAPPAAAPAAGGAVEIPPLQVNRGVSVTPAGGAAAADFESAGGSSSGLATLMHDLRRQQQMQQQSAESPLKPTHQHAHPQQQQQTHAVTLQRAESEGVLSDGVGVRTMEGLGGAPPSGSHPSSSLTPSLSSSQQQQGGTRMRKRTTSPLAFGHRVSTDGGVVPHTSGCWGPGGPEGDAGGVWGGSDRDRELQAGGAGAGGASPSTTSVSVPPLHSSHAHQQQQQARPNTQREGGGPPAPAPVGGSDSGGSWQWVPSGPAAAETASSASPAPPHQLRERGGADDWQHPHPPQRKAKANSMTQIPVSIPQSPPNVDADALSGGGMGSAAGQFEGTQQQPLQQQRPQPHASPPCGGHFDDGVAAAAAAASLSSIDFGQCPPIRAHSSCVHTQGEMPGLLREESPAIPPMMVNNLKMASRERERESTAVASSRQQMLLQAQQEEKGGLLFVSPPPAPHSDSGAAAFLSVGGNGGASSSSAASDDLTLLQQSNSNNRLSLGLGGRNRAGSEVALPPCPSSGPSAADVLSMPTDIWEGWGSDQARGSSGAASGGTQQLQQSSGLTLPSHQRQEAKWPGALSIKEVGPEIKQRLCVVVYGVPVEWSHSVLRDFINKLFVKSDTQHRLVQVWKALGQPFATLGCATEAAAHHLLALKRLPLQNRNLVLAFEAWKPKEKEPTNKESKEQKQMQMQGQGQPQELVGAAAQAQQIPGGVGVSMAVPQPQHTHLHLPPGLQPPTAAAAAAGQSSSISQIPSLPPSRTLPPVDLRPMQPALHSTLPGPPGLGLPTRSVSTQSPAARKQSVPLSTGGGTTGVCVGLPVMDSRPGSLSHGPSLLQHAPSAGAGGEVSQLMSHSKMLRMKQQHAQQAAAVASAGPFPSPPHTHAPNSPVWQNSPVPVPVPSPPAPPLHTEPPKRAPAPPGERNPNVLVSPITPDVPPGFEFEPQRPPSSPPVPIGAPSSSEWTGTGRLPLGPPPPSGQAAGGEGLGSDDLHSGCGLTFPPPGFA
uniref:Uncharacterized protein n=1 Tax=Chromera velia CCMP2878 TaxID=1169474 RepID=A0A0G4HIK5_9ALVE|eukprot:Cvel_7014.t1-p1 / transcript=Cvel_7014.t1 / gene=Cvel_7014 / organism=Chromera_velia_CCMP2878 / gene_product=hypothetical protein / transcript_product=hypothetical protein / location=Cvel_scaffold357:51247-61834(-) / protein_length=1896 / sequence_SO=supercontig / SO=protein_coding / is_pseudo=false